jgi:hypothetical protein
MADSHVPHGAGNGAGDHAPGLTGTDHEYSAAIGLAAQFLVATPPGERPKPLVPALREMFGLTPIDACLAIRESHSIRGGANAKP